MKLNLDKLPEVESVDISSEEDFIIYKVEFVGHSTLTITWFRGGIWAFLDNVALSNADEIRKYIEDNYVYTTSLEDRVDRLKGLGFSFD